MSKKDELSYTDLVYDVVRSARRPLTFQEILDEVNRRRQVSTKDPKSTIRNALTQGWQLVSIGDGRYGYLPHLVEGSRLRLPLTEKKPANHPLPYSEEVRQALWPSFFEIRKRANRRPVRMSLPNGDEVIVSLDMFGREGRGSPMPDGLRRYLVEERAEAGDSLLIRVVEGEEGRCEAWYESRSKRDSAAVARRNQELADAAYQVLIRRGRSYEIAVWHLAAMLLASGSYRSEVAPDPLEQVLRADPRFVDTGLQMWILAEAVTPRVQAIIQRRKEMEVELARSEEERGEELGRIPPGLANRHAAERTLADVGALLSERDFGSIEEANAFLRDVLAKGGVPRRRAGTPLEEAQDTMYDAWEATDPRERVRLAKKALETSPDCADAYVLLAEETARGPKEAAELYAKGVANGERALGKKAFEEGAGDFWGIIETRPYMRARLGLAQADWALGKRQRAIEHAWDMLRLNPNDNQGVRYLLLNWLLEMGDDGQVKKLLDQFPEDASAAWLYGRSLHAFRREGDVARARQLRAEAERENPLVPLYLVGRKRLPRRLPALVGFGDESEAVVCAAEQLAAWRKTPGAIAWLEKQLK